jgi:uncharacterized protein (DUF2236 family)
MIEFTKSYQTSDGETFAALEKAQVHQLQLLVPGLGDGEADALVKQSSAVVDTLTITANSKPKARKAHGGTKTRKPASTAATPS